jgi:hypothetical protein
MLLAPMPYFISVTSNRPSAFITVHGASVLVMSAYGRFCCRSPLQAFLVGDSVAVMRFATGAGDDGAAESRPGAVFLFISSR